MPSAAETRGFTPYADVWSCSSRQIVDGSSADRRATSMRLKPSASRLARYSSPLLSGSRALDMPDYRPEPGTFPAGCFSCSGTIETGNLGVMLERELFAGAGKSRSYRRRILVTRARRPFRGRQATRAVERGEGLEQVALEHEARVSA